MSRIEGMKFVEEINLKDLFNYFKSKISILILCTLIAAVIGCSYALFFQTPLYNSSTTLVLTRTDSEAGSSITQNEINLNQKLISNYRVIVKSRKVLDTVISNLNTNLTYEKLASKISVAAVEDTEVIKITVSDENPTTAKKIADETAKVFSSKVQELYQIKNINIVDEGQIATAPYNINILKQLIIYILIGFVIGFGIVFVIYYFDTTIKTTEEVENLLSLPILGQIPLRNTKRRSL